MQQKFKALLTIYLDKLNPDDTNRIAYTIVYAILLGYRRLDVDIGKILILIYFFNIFTELA